MPCSDDGECGWRAKPAGAKDGNWIGRPRAGGFDVILRLQPLEVIARKAMAAGRAGWIIGSVAFSADCSMLPAFRSCIVVADGDLGFYPICLCGNLGRHMG